MLTEKQSTKQVTSRSTSDFAFFCRASKANKDGIAPIELSICINGERKFIQLQMKAKPEEFAKKRQPKVIADYVANMRQKINEALVDMGVNGMPITADGLRAYLRTGGIKAYTVEALFKEWLAMLRKRIGVDLTAGAYRKYELTSELFFKYVGKERDVVSLMPADIENFYLSLKQIYQANSSASYMAKVKTCIQFAIDNGKIKINPFQGIKIKREKKPIKYLTKKDIKAIETTEYSTAALQRIADCFLFQCYSGLAFSDMECVKKADIQENNGVYFIQKDRVKTGVQFTAVLFPKALEVLKKYDYKLPIISNQKTNSALKAVAREAGLDIPLTNHYGRRTYGTLLLNSKVRMETVAKALGHADSKTTAKYYACLEDNTVINEVAEILY